MVSKNAGRFGAATAAGAAIPSPYAAGLATAAYGATVVGWHAPRFSEEHGTLSEILDRLLLPSGYPADDLGPFRLQGRGLGRAGSRHTDLFDPAGRRYLPVHQRAACPETKARRVRKIIAERRVMTAECTSANRFNRQLSPDEKKAIADKAGNSKDERDRLTKAACLAVKCWAEYPVGSDEYNKNYVTQLEATQL